MQKPAAGFLQPLRRPGEALSLWPERRHGVTKRVTWYGNNDFLHAAHVLERSDRLDGRRQGNTGKVAGIDPLRGHTRNCSRVAAPQQNAVSAPRTLARRR